MEFKDFSRLCEPWLTISELLNDVSSIYVYVLAEEIQFLFSADRRGVDQSVEHCFPDKEFSVCFVASKDVWLGLREPLQLRYFS